MSRRYRSPSARVLLGRRIVGFSNPTLAARDHGGEIYHPNPRIDLDDGSFLYFVAEETDFGEYGIFVGRSPATRKEDGHA